VEIRVPTTTTTTTTTSLWVIGLDLLGVGIAIYKVSPLLLLLLLGRKEEDKVAHSISMIAGRG
jgi:hypothetical protein